MFGGRSESRRFGRKEVMIPVFESVWGVVGAKENIQTITGGNGGKKSGSSDWGCWKLASFNRNKTERKLR